MTKEQALALIDEHKNKLIDPIAMLNWTYLRVYISCLTDAEWFEIRERAEKILRQ